MVTHRNQQKKKELNKKIYGIPLIVAQKVREGVEKSNDKVIEIVLERIAIKAQQSDNRTEYGVNEDWHRQHTIVGPYDRGCGCLYCEAFHRYVRTKISAHRLRRMIDNCDYRCYPFDPADYKQLRALEAEWVRLKTLKNQIKELTGL